MRTLLGPDGQPLRKDILIAEIGGATLSGVRSPATGYPGDGLTPARLAAILREADQGDPIRYMELAETIEERDPHYQGVLGTRRRAVSQIEITVEAGSDSAADEAIAEEIRSGLLRDTLTEEVFDILDCLGKGYSGTEITWDYSERQYSLKALERRDPRWFRFNRHDLTAPLLIDENGTEKPLDYAKWIFSSIKAKSGIPIRAGLARVAMWGYLFKKFTERDWAIFSQTYGHPLRLGKFGPGASAEDKRTLMRAVSNIAGDMAAIIPESMVIEFVEAANVGAAHALYKERCDWLDMQVSKAVLGQTATTDAVTGGLGSGEEHGNVRRDIETSDARALAAILNRDLIRPWVYLNHGPQKDYPRLVIARAEEEDLAAFSTAIGPLIDRGLPVSQAAVLKKFRLAEPQPGEQLLRPASASAPAPLAPPSDREIKRNPGEIKRGEPVSDTQTALNTEGPLAGVFRGVSPDEVLAERMGAEAVPSMTLIMGQIEVMLETAGSLEELREMLVTAFPQIETGSLAQVLGLGLVAAHAGGRVAVEEEST